MLALFRMAERRRSRPPPPSTRMPAPPARLAAGYLAVAEARGW
ncbi:MAG: hypothetical protein R3F11_05690 [Verrucomicrobiales bacterium]